MSAYIGNVICRDIINEEVVRKDATFGVVRVVTRVASPRRVTDCSRSEGSRLKRLLRVTTNRRNLLCKFESNSRIYGSCVVRCWVLVLQTRNCCQLIALRYNKEPSSPAESQQSQD